MKNISLISGFGIGAIVAAVGVYVYLTNQHAEVTVTLDAQIVEQHERLDALSEVLYRNTTPDELAVDIGDCTRGHRNRFDNFLMRLNTLPASEFPELRLLFDACADYFANQKEITLAAFVKEIDTLDTLLLLQDQLDPLTEPDMSAAAKWRLVADLETKRYNILREQVTIQADIIQLLENGATPSDAAIEDKMQRANEITETGSVLVHEVNAARAAVSRP